MSESFKPMPGNEELLVPAHIAAAEQQAAYQQNPDYQEMKAQNEVLGTDGLGSLKDRVQDEMTVTDKRSSADALGETFSTAEKKVTSEQLADQKDAVEEIVTEAGNRIIRTTRTRRGASRKQGAPADSSEQDDIEAVMVGDKISQTIEEGQAKGEKPAETEKKVQKIVETAKKAEADSPAAEPKSTETPDESDIIARHIARIKNKIASSDEAAAAFAEGGEKAFVDYLEKSFVGNKRLQKLAKAFDAHRESENGARKRNGETPEHSAEVEPVVAGAKHEAGKGKAVEKGSDSGPGAPKELEGSPKAPEVKRDEVLEQAFVEAADKYAELTAKDRKSHFIGRYTKDPRSMTGKILRKIPGVRKLTDNLIDRANERQGRAINEARQQYESAVGALQQNAVDQLRAQGASDAEVSAAANLANGEADMFFESTVISHRENQSGNANKFVSWWTEQQGFKGKLKKFAVVAGAGAAVMGTAGAVVPGFLAAAAAAGTGAGIAKHVAGRRANAVGEDGFNVAERQALADFEEKRDKLQTPIDLSDRSGAAWYSPKFLTNVTERRSNEEAFENRSRMRQSIAAAKIGAAGLVGVRRLAEGIDIKNPFDGSDSKPDGAQEAPKDAPPKADPDIKGNSFTVEAGNGYTHELMDFAQVNGHELTPRQAFRLHEHLMDRFGQDYINIKGAGNDIYTQGGDVRLMEPGQARWSKGVTTEAQKWMSRRGLW